MGFSRQGYWSGLQFPSPGESSQPTDQTRSPSLQADSLPTEPPRNPKNTGVGSPSLLQGIFPTQELNRGLLHCRRIPQHLSYQGSLCPAKHCIKPCVGPGFSSGVHLSSPTSSPWEGKHPWLRKRPANTCVLETAILPENGNTSRSGNFSVPPGSWA